MVRLIKGSVIGLIGYYLIDYILNDALPCPLGLEHIIVVCMALGVAVYVLAGAFNLGGKSKDDNL